MTPAKITAFNAKLSQPAPDDVPPLTVELDELADKLARQRELNAVLMCQVKRLESVNKKLMKGLKNDQR